MSFPFKERVREKLARLSLRRLAISHQGEAAVLMALYEEDGTPHFLLTRRTEEVSTHKGQISFPGGLRQPRDASLQATALRETREEVGVSSRYIEILGEYHQYLAVTQHLVTPIVAFLKEGFSVRPNPREVEEVVRVPVNFFEQTEPVREYRKRFGKRVPVYFYEYRGHVVWGLTAAMIKDFVEWLAGEQDSNSMSRRARRASVRPLPGVRKR